MMLTIHTKGSSCSLVKLFLVCVYFCATDVTIFNITMNAHLQLPPPPPFHTSPGRYFSSCKCRVTKGSTSSQHTGLNFKARRAAYFITLVPLGSLSLSPNLSPPPPSQPRSVPRVCFLAVANCPYLAVSEVPPLGVSHN